MTFNPQYSWFFKRFNRGVPDETIAFYGPIHENDPDSLEMELQRNEELFLSMKQTEKRPSAWLTTKRFIWDNNKEKHQFYLKEIAYVRLEILNKPDIPSDNPDHYDLALQIRCTSLDKI